ncbi:MAG: DNA methyltransferase [Thermocrinis sp.]|jgi:DNA modification methylase|uniref:DNA methyltransferase n=1 Tax=Thermocrinis sp. TaxID=2024383 RepID=UPI003C02DC38
MHIVRDASLDFKGIPAGQGLHGIHPYPAMFHFLLVRKFIRDLSSEGDLILDPFCGSGVSAVEALLNNRNYVGYDINPLAVLIAKVRTTPIPTEKALKQLKLILKHDIKDYEVPEFPNIEYWFDEDVIEGLAKLRAAIFDVEDVKFLNLFKVSFSETVRLVSRVDRSEFKLVRAKRVKKQDVKLVFEAIARRNIVRLSVLSKLPLKASVDIQQLNVLGDLPLKDESVDLVITSPPYGDSKTTVAYEQFSKLSIKWLGLDDSFKNYQLGAKEKSCEKGLPSEELNECLEEIKKRDEKRAKEVYSFYADLYRAIENISRKVQPGKHAIVVVGNRWVRGVELPTDKICVSFFRQLGFTHIATLVREISNKRMPSGTMKYEYVVILQKKPL